jgi:hypothetical protein
MKSNLDLLRQHLGEQIAIEEHLNVRIKEQISTITDPEFADARTLLQQTADVLERHFEPLNRLLAQQENEQLSAENATHLHNGLAAEMSVKRAENINRVSSFLRDDYSALNLVTISNTLLHATALALKKTEVADVALTHLTNLAPLVVRIGELLPETITRELRAISEEVDPLSAKVALRNTKLAWRRQ